MKLQEFKELLEANQDKKIVLYLPNGNPVPRHFHITEAGYVRRRFVDCGGGWHDQESCLLQAWVAGDEDHSLLAGKLAKILQLAEKLFPDGCLPVEIEYEDQIISQYPVASVEVTPQSLLFFLEAKHTDCLAKETCGVTEADAACRSGSGCC